MRPKLVIIFYLLPLLSLSQPSPVDVDLHVDQLSERHYRLQFRFGVEKGWHVYADGDSALALDALQICIVNNESLVLSGGGTDPAAISKMRDVVFDNKPLAVYQESFTLKRELYINGPVPPVARFSIKGFASNNKEFVPFEFTKQLELASGGYHKSASLVIPSIHARPPFSDCGDTPASSSKGLLAIFLLGFGGGLLALLTPCVFPMVPVTVAYFTKNTGLRQAQTDKHGTPLRVVKGAKKSKGIQYGLLYGGFILMIYLLASVPFHLISNISPEIFNTISTNAWVNVFFFIVFIFFALSFFGLFEIKMPSFVTNAAGSKGGLGSVGGIFFMALTLATVSFSCTGPILGSLLVGSLSAHGGAWQLTSGMAGFGLALALPFGLFAMFPQWMKRLPKSGGWLNTTKKVLAFLELALAFKFLSNADLVEHWGILKREVFIGAWVVVFLSLTIYLFNLPWYFRYGKIKASKGRIAFGFLTLFFTLYLTPGLTQSSYANLKLLSGFPPPLSYSIYGKENVKGKGLEPDVINDYDKALALAKKTGKPLLIDFTGWACVNCRKMEEQVWTKPEIQKLIKEKFILVSLYVDDRNKLPVDQRFVYKDAASNEKEIVTVGDKWATFQAENFKQVTQPLYVILNKDEQLMNRPVGYTPDVKEYQTWLECGLAR